MHATLTRETTTESPPRRRHRIAIVEDDLRTRELLIEIISHTPELELVSHYADSTQALVSLPQDRPDVILMDINMPKLNGVECVQQVKPLMPDVQILMLTVYEDPDHIFAALAAGATGYLLKSTRRDELLAAIEQIVQGGSPMSSSIARKVVQLLQQPKPQLKDATELSKRENEVLALLAQGYLYKEIADTLGIGNETVNTYIRRIYEKLHVHSRSQAVARYANLSR